jgi:4-hydroxybenzoate polyprenyltransferase
VGGRGPGSVAIGRVPLYLNFVRIHEALFALPFAYIGMILAAGGWPGWHDLIWINVAMAGARTLGMAANRLVHRKEDAINPRTAGRHLPTGLIKPWEAGLMMAVSTGVLIYGASQLNALALALAPVAAAYVVLYSYTKYLTWACHFVLGGALAIAPSAAWIGVTGSLGYPPMLLTLAVAGWAGGFDTLYGCADYDFDRTQNVYSIAKRFGIKGALITAKVAHLVSAAALLALGIWLEMGVYYFAGWTIAVLLLIFENSLVTPANLSKLNSPFFKYNSVISLVLLVFTILDVAL